MKTIIKIGLPAPLSLVPNLLHTVTEWHDRECGVPRCIVSMTIDGLLVHDVPEDDNRPSPPPGDDRAFGN